MIMLLILLLSTGVAYAEMPTELDVKFAVGRILLENDKTFRGDGAEQIWQSPVCYFVSYRLAKKLKEDGFEPYLCLNKSHMNIGIWVKDKDGSTQEMVIDPTYRQFFIIDRYEDNHMTRLFEFTNMPRVLMALRKDLKKTISGFSLQPKWEIDKSPFGFDYYFGLVARLPIKEPDQKNGEEIDLVRQEGKILNLSQFNSATLETGPGGLLHR